MRDESIIIDLYDHFDELNMGFQPRTKAYENVVKDREDTLERLRKLIPKEAEFLLEEFLERSIDVATMEDKEIYRQGVCFGIKITSEAFVANRNRAVINGDDY